MKMRRGGGGEQMNHRNGSGDIEKDKFPES